MADHVGFDDSSSDEDEDDDLNNNNNNANDDDGDDDWINTKPKQMEETAQEKERKRKEIELQRKFSNYLAPQSLEQMKQQIYTTSHHKNTDNGNKSLLPPPPPPLQDLTDNTTISYNRTTNKYKAKHSHRPQLSVTEYVPPSKHPWHQHPQITGVSAQTSVGCKIKLNDIVNELRNVEYKPEEFVAVRMRLKNPAMTVTIFSNGKLTTQGGRSQYSCIIALRKVARMLSHLDRYKNDIKSITEPTFYGIQSNAHLGKSVDLAVMAEAFPNRVEYSPDIESSYLKFRQPLKYGDKGACHVYHSGRITILGCNSVATSITWLEDMYGHCLPHLIKDEMDIDQNKISNRDFQEMFASSNNKNENKNNNNDYNKNDNSNVSAFGNFAPPPVFGNFAPPPLLN